MYRYVHRLVVIMHRDVRCRYVGTGDGCIVHRLRRANHVLLVLLCAMLKGLL